MTEAEKLALIKKELFEGFNLEDITWIAEGDRRQLMLMHAERILGLKPNGETARYYALEIYGEKLGGVNSPFLYAPHEDVDGWLSDLMKLLACLLDNNPWGHCFSLRWLSVHFDAENGDDPNQFSPNNEQLLVWLERTVDRRIAALVGKMVQDVAALESQRKMSVAVYDYYVDMLNQYRNIDCANVDECDDYVDSLLETINDIAKHMKRGLAMGLSTEEIGLIDSLWSEVPHNYPSDYVAAAKEIWQKIKAVRDNFADGRKTRDDCDLFVNDMVKIVLPIAKKHGIDMELDDEHSLPLNYLKYWLDSIYYGDDSRFE